MTNMRARLHAITLDAFEIQCPAEINFGLGQYFLASARGMMDLLPKALFPRASTGRSLVMDGPVPEGWEIGMALDMRGPLGRGFHIPAAVRKIAIVEIQRHMHATAFFQPWMESFSAAGGELVFYSPNQPAGLPSAVEGLPLEQAAEAWKWADYLVADVDLVDLGRFLRILMNNPSARLPDRAEVLVRTAMPCGGTAECGVCAVKTVKGFRLACKHGPVFPLAELAREAK